jgi:hypothetical protein
MDKIEGKLGPGDFLILGGAMASILSRLQAVATINEQYQNAIVSARRLIHQATSAASMAISRRSSRGASRLASPQNRADASGVLAQKSNRPWNRFTDEAWD